MHLPLFPVQTIMIVQSRGQIYAMSCICAVIMNVGANVSSAENSDAAMSVNFINQENVKNKIKPPYVCNGCSKRTNCMMDKKIYSSKYAQDSYEALRTTSREGINQTPESIQKLDNLLSPLLKKGQSIAHIYASHADEIACSRRNHIFLT